MSVQVQPHTVSKKESGLEENEQKLSLWVSAVLLVVASVLCYLPAFKAGFVWDDDVYVIFNPAVRDWHGLWRIWFAPFSSTELHYWPVVHTSFWLDFRLWGEAATGWHSTNIALHTICVMLVWQVLSMLRIRGARLAALLFAVHPVHVESVAWVIERKDTLSTLFYLLAFISWIHWQREGSRMAAVGAALCCLLGVWSKSVAATLPAGLLIWRWWESGRITRRDLLGVVPIVLIIIAGTGFDTWVLQQHEGSVRSVPLGTRFVESGAAFWLSSAKLLWPYPLSPIYPPVLAGWPETLKWIPAGCAVLFLAVLFTLRRRIGRAPFAAAAFYAVTLAPSIGVLHFAFLDITRVADRFQYLASAAPLALLAAFGFRLARISRGVERSIVLALGCIIVILLSAATFGYCEMWHDRVTLFRQALRYAPNSPHAHYQLSIGLRALDRNDEAFSHAKRAVELAPSLKEAQKELDVFLK